MCKDFSLLIKTSKIPQIKFDHTCVCYNCQYLVPEYERDETHKHKSALRWDVYRTLLQGRSSIVTTKQALSEREASERVCPGIQMDDVKLVFETER